MNSLKQLEIIYMDAVYFFYQLSNKFMCAYRDFISLAKSVMKQFKKKITHQENNCWHFLH